MRIITWNVNGFNTFLNYSPWYSLGSYDKVFDHLQADVFCCQELKLPRSNLTKAQACPFGYDGFFSFPQTGKGYSGVGVFTSQAVLVPHKVEEGITGQRAPSRTQSSCPPDPILPYPVLDDLPLRESIDNNHMFPHKLDLEGRALTLDLGLFILINVYCPNETNEDRLPFKLNFLTVLEARVQELVKSGREVMLVGDMNVVHHPRDHGEGTLASKQNGFWDHPVGLVSNRFVYPPLTFNPFTGRRDSGSITFWRQRES